MSKRRPTSAVIALLTSAAIALSACGGGGGSGSATSSDAKAAGTDFAGVKIEKDAGLRSQLPDKYRTQGSFIYATNGLGPPRSYVDESGKVVGAVPDLLNAIGALWGVTATVEKVDFAAQVPGVQSGRYDISADTGDFATRLTAVDMVDFMVAGAALVVKKGNPKKITGLDESLCGLTIAVTTGTTQETSLATQSQACTSAGKPAITVQSLASGSLEVPITAGRADAAFDNTSTAAMLVQKQPDQFALGGKLMIQANLAFSVSKENTEFFKALQNALQKLHDNGAYKAILKKWNQSELALDKVLVNTGAPAP